MKGHSKKFATRSGWRTPRRSLLVLALASVMTLSAHAQSTSAVVRGQVAGASGGVAAQITASNVETGFSRSVTAGADGTYALPGLPPGTYQITASSGDQSATQTVTLRVGQTARLDLPPDDGLPADEATLETVTAVGQVVVETKTSEVATYITPQQIAALPQASRNFLAFADLVPGMQFETKSDGSTSLRGGAQSSNGINVYIDGVGQKNYVLKGGVSGQDSSRGSPFPQLAIAEYKVITQNYKAEFDQLSSAAITAVTKSGTNDFHGGVFYDRTTDNWRASTPRELDSGLKVDSKEEQYGMSFGGPIIEDVLHYFVSYEAKDFVSPRDVRIGENVPINLLPADLASQVGTTSAPFEMDLFFGKLSWAPGTQHLFELTTKYRRESELTGIGDGPNTPSYGTSKDNDDTRVDLRHQFSGEGILNDAHITFEDASFNPRPITDAVGYRLVTPDRRTILNAGGGQDFQDKSQRGFGLQNDLTFFDLSWRGNHTVKMGFKYKDVKISAFEQQPANPQFEYDITESLTIPFRVEFGAAVPGVRRNVESSNKQFGVYIQDDWEVNERLTLNMGIRWDYERTPSYLDYKPRAELVSALRNWTNLDNADYDIEDYISNGSNREAFKDAFQPRVGFSYDFSDDETAVLFGGAGRSYDRNLFDYLALEQSKGTFPRYAYTFNTPNHPCSGATCLNFNPSFLDPNVLAGLVAANPNLGGEINLIANDIKTPYSDQFSVGFRKTFGDWNGSLTLSNIRSYDGIVFRLGNRRPDGSFQPPGATWSNAPFGFPIPGFGSLILADNGIETKQNAILVSMDKPFTRESGWGVTFAYTFSDAEENRVNAANSDEHYLFDYANIEDHGWHRSTGIARHRIVATGIYEAPWGLLLSAKATVESPSTYEAVNCNDAPDFNNCFFDPLTPRGTFGKRQLDLAVSKDLSFAERYTLNFRIDVLNVFNTRNYNEFDTWRGGPGEDNANFGVHTQGISLPTRMVKASMAFNW